MNIKVGQVYRSNDPREDGRKVQVSWIDTGNSEPAYVRVSNVATGRESLIRARVFGSKARSGFTLVQDVGDGDSE